MQEAAESCQSPGHVNAGGDRDDTRGHNGTGATQATAHPPHTHTNSAQLSDLSVEKDTRDAETAPSQSPATSRKRQKAVWWKRALKWTTTGQWRKAKISRWAVRRVPGAAITSTPRSYVAELTRRKNTLAHGTALYRHPNGNKQSPSGAATSGKQAHHTTY